MSFTEIYYALNWPGWVGLTFVLCFTWFAVVTYQTPAHEEFQPLAALKAPLLLGILTTLFILSLMRFISYHLDENWVGWASVYAFFWLLLLLVLCINSDKNGKGLSSHDVLIGATLISLIITLLILLVHIIGLVFNWWPLP